MKKISLAIISCILMAGTIDLNNLFPYSEQSIPDYIQRDNTGSNSITDLGATLGRVLFYDKNLSANNTVSCASCHQQQFAFGDTSALSTGLNGGLTGRHSMRLVYGRFSNESRFFWDERAVTLEDQTTKPIQDHIEMGFSGLEGSPNMNNLIGKLSGIDHYPILFNQAFGTKAITEEQISHALAQFVRSIQSFDSKFDEGLALVDNIIQPFPNYSVEENAGKRLFLQPLNAGGTNCQACHRAPEFDIDRNSRNNGVIEVAGSPKEVDLTNTRAPSLRDVFNPSGNPNGPFMHNGSLATIRQVINHYNDIDFDEAINPLLDNRLRGGGDGSGQKLNLTEEEKNQLESFLHTLTSSRLYIAEEYSDPFDENGQLTLIDVSTSTVSIHDNEIKIYPNPSSDFITIEGIEGNVQMQSFDIEGKLVLNQPLIDKERINISFLNKGIYNLTFYKKNKLVGTKRFIKN